jgi:putative ABC transport system ATP-binding protein
MTAEVVTMIEIQDLTKVYGSGEAEVQALRGVDLEVQRGEFVAVMGPSGSGKSTLMNILGCLDRPTAGSYVLDGEDVSRMNRDQLADVRNRKIGFVFQAYNLLPRTSAVKNVMLPLLYQRNGHQSEADLQARAVAALEAVGLGKRLNHRPNELSGGQQQRVAVARALIARPAVLFADEPTGNLDSRAGGEVLNLLRRSVDDFGQTVIMVTHDAGAASIADNIVFLRDGRIEFVNGRMNRDRIYDVIKNLEAADRAADEQADAVDQRRAS